jgi:hypothetical protein
MAIYTPPNYGAQYPGSPIYGQPPATGRANYTPITPGPATATANYTNPTPTAPGVAARVKVSVPVNTVTVLEPMHISSTLPPIIGVPNIVPFPTPIGVYPPQTTPNEDWSYDYGPGGAGGNDAGP